MNRIRYARSGNVRIAYELRGTVHRRRPWLVLVQGIGLDRLGWQPVLGKLGRHFRLVLPDNRGSGRSDRPAGSLTVADMVADVIAVLDATSRAPARPVRAGVLSAQAAAGARYAGQLRQARIRARTLVLHGDADTVVDPRNAKLLAARIPDAQLVIRPGLGHLLFWEDPDTFADAVTAFLLAG